MGCAGLPPAATPPVPPPTSATGANGTTIVAIAPAAGPKGTIWDFLGVKALCKDLAMVADCGMNLLGAQFPGLASSLPMSSLTNPSAAASSNPAVAAAAAAKADENAAGGKVAALRYLGTLGCGGCYPEVEKALLAGLDDCIEVVRFEAASALATSSRNHCCRYCMSNRCCSANVRKKLIEIAMTMNDNGCYREPSARVRRMARVALCQCACDPADGLMVQPTPMEGPSSEGPSAEGTVPPPPTPDPQVAVIVHDFHSQQKQASSDGSAGRRSLAQHQASTRQSSASRSASNRPVLKSYDDSHKPEDIVIKTSDQVSKPSVTVANDSLPQSPFGGAKRNQTGPRIRWERAAVTIYRFENKTDALAAMEYIRRKSLGEDVESPDDPNLRYITTRVSGWTRAQDIRSPELAKILFELPVGQVSPVIEVGDTLTVCRVLEKDDPDEGSGAPDSREVYNSNFSNLE